MIYILSRVANFLWMWRGRSTFLLLVFWFSFRFSSEVVVGGEGSVHHVLVLVGWGGVHGEW